jgi:hypothetical protein
LRWIEDLSRRSYRGRLVFNESNPLPASGLDTHNRKPGLSMNSKIKDRHLRTEEVWKLVLKLLCHNEKDVRLLAALAIALISEGN